MILSSGTDNESLRELKNEVKDLNKTFKQAIFASNRSTTAFLVLGLIQIVLGLYQFIFSVQVSKLNPWWGVIWLATIFGTLYIIFRDFGIIKNKKNMKTILVDAVNAFVVEKNGSFEIFKEMHDLLETFPNRKIILTGANDEQYKQFGLDKMPYDVFTLKHNPEKTDPKYFEILLEKFNLDKESVVYFEHNPDAVKSAELAGIVSWHYDQDKKDLSGLKAFLDKNL